MQEIYEQESGSGVFRNDYLKYKIQVNAKTNNFFLPETFKTLLFVKATSTVFTFTLAQ